MGGGEWREMRKGDAVSAQWRLCDETMQSSKFERSSIVRIFQHIHLSTITPDQPNTRINLPPPPFPPPCAHIVLLLTFLRCLPGNFRCTSCERRKSKYKPRYIRRCSLPVTHTSGRLSLSIS
jgi:hypothetical protein